jgi:hypothetical protein
VLRVWDVYPGFEFFPSRIRIKEFKYFNPKKLFLSTRKYDPGCSSRVRILIFYPPQDPGVEKAPDTGSGSATLEIIHLFLAEPRRRLSQRRVNGKQTRSRPQTRRQRRRSQMSHRSPTSPRRTTRRANQAAEMVSRKRVRRVQRKSPRWVC